jgi:hemolysin III
VEETVFARQQKRMESQPDIKHSLADELVNAITHGVGALLAIAALVLLVVFSSIYGSAWEIVSFTIFGTTLVLLYLASTLYHSLTNARAKFLFRKFDHMAIFLLIAGTYTPFCLSALGGWIGWTIFSAVWVCAILGIVFKALFTGRMELLSTIMYILMGWIIVIAIKPLYESISLTTFILLLAGGLSYTAGTFFYMKEKIRFSHGIWHVFVLGGSTLHFFSVMSLLAS